MSLKEERMVRGIEVVAVPETAVGSLQAVMDRALLRHNRQGTEPSTSTNQLRKLSLSMLPMSFLAFILQ